MNPFLNKSLDKNLKSYFKFGFSHFHRIVGLIGCLSTLFVETPWCATTNFWQQDVWQQAERGFLFYEPDKAEEKTPPDRSKTPTFTELSQLKAEQQRRLEAAVMDPSEGNMQAYLQINALMLEKSSAFADAWRRTLWAHPQYDFTRTWPSANFAQVALQARRQDEQKQALTSLASRWGLIFVVRRDCPFCDMMAPVAQKLQSALKMPVLAVYIGNEAPAAWPEAKPDNGILKKLELITDEPISVTPSLFMLNKADGSVHRVSDGALSLSELLKRLYVIDSVPSGENAFHAMKNARMPQTLP